MTDMVKSARIWFCVLLVVSGAMGPDLAVAAEEKSALPSEGYLLAPEDVLDISVWREETLQKQVLVRPDGGISFPLVGEIQAAGKTAAEIREEITRRLKPFLANPAVSVGVLKIAGYKVYVSGKVLRPGEYVAGRYVDVLQALTMAGGITPFAAENDIKVLRKENGKDKVFSFRYSDVRKGLNLSQNIVLKPGDVVVVP